MERMSTLDTGFFFVEHENVPMHIGSVAVFEGPAPAYEDPVELVAAKLPLVPRYRQVVRTTPLQIFRPVWADDPHFEIGYHVRHAAVPAPGGASQLRKLAARIFAQRLDRAKPLSGAGPLVAAGTARPGASQLRKLAARIFAQRLDRARPLWEAWLLEGLKGGRWALISKVHHCMVDGIGGNDLMAAIFDLGPAVGRPAAAAWDPGPGPSVTDLVTGGILDAATWSLRQLSAVAGFRRLSLPPRDELLGFSRGLTGSARRLTAPSASSLNGPIGPTPRWAWTTASLSEAKELRSALGGTVNDVLLAAITRGFRDLLEARGELTDGLVVRSLVPVSVRTEDEQGVIANRVSAVLANLPVGEPDPLRRLALLRTQMDDLKRTRQAVGAEILTGMLGFAAPTLLALGSRAAFMIPQPLVQTVTTNVPGPRFPLFLLGRRMIKMYPYVPIGNNLRIGVAIISYLDRFSFGITADYAAVPDVGVLAKGISRGLAELGGHAAGARRG